MRAWLATLASLPDDSTLTDAQAELCLLLRLGYVPAEYAVVAAAADSMLPAPPEAKPEPTGTHYGTLKERTQAAGCQCTHVANIGPSQAHPEYGDRWLCKFTTPCGAELVWFASSDKWLPEAGKSFDIKFTPVSHSDYQDKRQTIIQRVAPL